MTVPYAEVIGDPIAQSKSPIIHSFWLEALGIEAGYRKTLVHADGLAAYFAARTDDPAWRGCNITLPHKIAALDHVDDPAGVRETIGATNCVFRDSSGALAATNTDAAGFAAPLAPFELAGAPAAVIGSGGAARAVLFALAQIGVGPVTLMARDPAKAGALLATFGLQGKAQRLDAPVPPVALLANASSLGMTGQAPLAIDLAPLPHAAVVYDIIYSPLETDLLAQARHRGLTTLDGLDMLVGQAAAAFEIFFGAAPPRDRDVELRRRLLA